MDVAANARAFMARPFAAPLRRAWHELLNPPAPPKRVARAIRDAEATAEIVVSWVQLGGLTVFGFLYLASLSAFQVGTNVGPVPIALALYGVFVAWRLRLAYRDALSPRLLSVSAGVDVGVLMILIWSFTLQYQAPAALYLKAPTLLYAFALIALRALRFDAGHVLLTGLLTIAGWIGLVFIAARDAPVVSDYVSYMTSLSVLWGAEAEKIAAIAAATLVLALAVSRSRSLLARTVIEETAARDLSRFLDSTAARRVRAAETELKPGDGELKPMAIMFLDLRGFSQAAARLPPKDVIGLLQEYQGRFVPIIEAAGGSVDKYLGDGILVSFGGGDHKGVEARDAFAVVPAIVAEADAWARTRALDGAPPIDVAVAITHGEVIHGVIGHRDRLEFTVIGDAVNVAAKLEKHAKTERARVIATRTAIERAAAQGRVVRPVRSCPNAVVDGVAEPVDLAIIA
ncbi:MAG: adenylate/guanylate cyclase domain-containing protein [Alphaproteobacteria bacterium]|nr:adenylate/guanylate cyclase domain-containing protein [Alphaproteobacteria bacterium]